MIEIDNHTININESILEAMKKINELPKTLTLFVVNEERQLIGTLTDGDIRRGFINGNRLDENVLHFMSKKFHYLEEGEIDVLKIKDLKVKGIRLLPVLDSEKRISKIYNIHKLHSILPIDAVIMAGGKGSRLLPLTQNTPKPLLPIGKKPIIGYNLERLQKFGIKNISITVNYLKEKIIKYITDLPENGCIIKCIEEIKPLGTIGSLSLIKNWQNDFVLLTNSDLLTTIDYEDFFLEFQKSGADMMVAVIPYPIKVPYAILETKDDKVESFKEKPEYIHYANTGIYLLKRNLISLIPQEEFFNATDLMDKLILENRKIGYYPMVNYWLDIGKHDDYKKAQEDIKHLRI